MADHLPKILELARSSAGQILVECNRPERMTKELRKHLPHHDITVNGKVVILRSRLPQDRRCGSGPECVGGGVFRLKEKNK